MGYQTKVFIERRGRNSWEMVATIFASNPQALMKFLHGKTGSHGLPDNLSGGTLDNIRPEEDRGSTWWTAEDYMRAYKNHYKKHPVRRWLKRKYVEPIMDVIAWFLEEETDMTGRVICFQDF